MPKSIVSFSEPIGDESKLKSLVYVSIKTEVKNITVCVCVFHVNLAPLTLYKCKKMSLGHHRGPPVALKYIAN